MNKTLAPRQAAFVQEYLIDLNATQAAIRAGYSAKTAEVQGPRLLGNVRVQDALHAAMAARSERTGVTQDQVVRELAQIAFSDMSDYLSWGPQGMTLKDSAELPEGASNAVAGVSEHRAETGRTVRFKLHNKLNALIALAKHLGMFQKGSLKGDRRVQVTRVTVIASPGLERERTVEGMVTRVE